MQCCRFVLARRCARRPEAVTLSRLQRIPRTGCQERSVHARAYWKIYSSSVRLFAPAELQAVTAAAAHALFRCPPATIPRVSVCSRGQQLSEGARHSRHRRPVGVGGPSDDGAADNIAGQFCNAADIDPVLPPQLVAPVPHAASACRGLVQAGHFIRCRRWDPCSAERCSRHDAVGTFAVATFAPPCTYPVSRWVWFACLPDNRLP